MLLQWVKALASNPHYLSVYEHLVNWKRVIRIIYLTDGLNRR